MSIMGMRRKFAHHLKTILWIILAVFVISIPLLAFYSGRSSFPGATRGPQEAREDKEKVVATIGNEKITRAQWDSSYDNLLQQQASYSVSLFGTTGVPLTSLLGIRYQALKQLSDELVFTQEAHSRGLSISNSELNSQLDKIIDNSMSSIQQQARTAKRDPRELYRLVLAQNGTQRDSVSESDFRDWLRQQLDSHREDLQREILINKLQTSITKQVQVTDSDLLANFDQAKVRMIVILIGGAKKRTEAQAKEEADKLYSQLKAGTNFASLAQIASDMKKQSEPQSFSRLALAANFGAGAEKTIFTLPPGGFTPPLKTQFAYVILKLEEKNRNLPSDFDKKKEELRKQLLQQRQQLAWKEFSQEALQKVKLKPQILELEGLMARAENRQEDTIKAFEKAVQDPAGIPGEIYCAICYDLGQYYATQKKWDKALQNYEGALSPPSNIQTNVIGFPDEIYLALGQVYLAKKDNKKALEYLNQASESGVNNYLLHVKLQDIYTKLGDKQKAVQEQTWLTNFREQQQKAMQQAAEGMKQGQGNTRTKPTTPTQPSPKKP